MKTPIIQSLLLTLSVSASLPVSAVWAEEQVLVVTREVAPKDLPFPTQMECKVEPFYGHRADGKAGRAIRLNFTDAKLYGTVDIEFPCLRGIGNPMRFPNGDTP